MRVALAFTFLGVTVSIAILIMILLLPSRALRVKVGNLYGHFCGPTLVRLCGGTFDPRPIQALTRQHRPAIYLFNHGSAMDAFIIISVCAIGSVGVGKKEIIKTPFFGLGFYLAGQLLIDRSNKRKAVESMKETGGVVLAHNLSVCIAPEGTQSNDGRLLPFKKGFAHMAMATRLPIVPVVIKGAHRVWPARTWDMGAGSIEIEVLDPIPTTDWTRENMDQRVAALHAMYNNALPDDQKALG